ncbi:DJ-1 family glyoxalase III [Helicobacter equorum]|uniref:DJ-1 family glyoxalase III n=1 Tax=Helicobacter equorum TaxID=361872 RepID=UPI000CF02A3D|nr:DJ-1 family glyoxalase III [Helicobacter equorum]
MKKVIVPIAKGFEEIELISIVDILRRVQIPIEILSLESHKKVVGAHNITLYTDDILESKSYQDYACIALAGGYENMQRMCQHHQLGEILTDFYQQHKLIAALCASPIVLAHFGVLKNNFTCYPSCQHEVRDKTRTSNFIHQNVYFEDHILTSQGPATAMEFALTLADIVLTQDFTTYQMHQTFQNTQVQKVAEGLLYHTQ